MIIFCIKALCKVYKLTALQFSDYHRCRNRRGGAIVPVCFTLRTEHSAHSCRRWMPFR